ncbi:MAG: hypothetical protein ACI84E_001450, partial [Planctomycetota bacterium]
GRDKHCVRGSSWRSRGLATLSKELPGDEARFVVEEGGEVVVSSEYGGLLETK